VNEKLQMGNMLVGTFLESQMKERDRQAFAERDRERIEAERQRLIFDTAIRNGIPLSRIASSAPIPVASQPMQQPALPSSASSEEGVSLIDAAKQAEQNNANVVPQNIVGEPVATAKPPQQKVNVFNVDPSYVAVSDVQQEGIAAEQAIAQERERQIKGYEQEAESFKKEFEINRSELETPKKENVDKYQLWINQRNALDKQTEALKNKETLLRSKDDQHAADQIAAQIKAVKSDFKNFEDQKWVENKIAFYDSKAITDLRKNIPAINSTIAQAKGYLEQKDRQKANNVIHTFIAKQGNSLTSPDALANAERDAVAAEVKNFSFKGATSDLFNRSKNGEFTFKNLTGTDLESYLDRMQDSIDAIAAAQNKMIFTEIANPLGSYAKGKVFPISGYSFVEENNKIPNGPIGNAPQGATPNDPLKKAAPNRIIINRQGSHRE